MYSHIIKTLRPWSVDSLNGGSTDEPKKAPVNKKNWSQIGKILKSHIFASNRPTERSLLSIETIIIMLCVTHQPFWT